MPPAANQALVPPADLQYFIGATVQTLKDRLSALGIPFNEYDRKYVLYYRIATTGNRLLNMPVGYVPTHPPMPPALPAVVGLPNHQPLPVPAAPAVAPAAAPPASQPVQGKPTQGKQLGKQVHGKRLPRKRVHEEVDEQNEQNEQNDDSEITVRIEAKATDECTYNGTDGAAFEVKLQVFDKHRPAFRSLIGYYASVSLRPAGSDDWEDIGSIVAYGFSRPTVQHPNINPELWRTEWLEGDIDESKYANGTESIAKALRSIYSDNGIVKGRVARQFRGQLASDGTGHGLIYIAQLYIKQQNATTGETYEGNGFGGRALSMFYRLLQGGTLPIWYGSDCPTTYVLEPGLLEDREMSQKWRSTKKAEESENALVARVERFLTIYYTDEKRGYSIYANWTSSEWGMTTLGRYVDPAEVPRQQNDSVIGDWRSGFLTGIRPRPSALPASSTVSPSSVNRSSKSQDDLDVTPTRAPRKRSRHSSV